MSGASWGKLTTSLLRGQKKEKRISPFYLINYDAEAEVEGLQLGRISWVPFFSFLFFLPTFFEIEGERFTHKTGLLGF